MGLVGSPTSGEFYDIKTKHFNRFAMVTAKILEFFNIL
jgi:hypothetical protein